MTDDGYATLADTTNQDGKLACADGAAVRHPDTAVSGPRKRILFQSVPEGS
jgi:hypothetical protein